MTSVTEHFKISKGVPDKMKLVRAFWSGLESMGLAPGAVLHHSGIPASAYTGECIITTAEYFRFWRTIRQLSHDPTFGWKVIAGIDSDQFHPTLLAALQARTYRESLGRLARYKQLCGAQEFRFVHNRNEFRVEASWPYAAGEQPPPLLLDAVFAIVMELGRRGLKTRLAPKRVELRRTRETKSGLEGYFGCPIKYEAARDAVVLKSEDMDRPFLSHNKELLEMLTDGFENQLKTRNPGKDTIGQVKWVLKRLLAGSRPDVSTVAKELGLSERTLQRRITEEGTSFRQLLHDTRRELVRQYLGDDSVEIAEAAFLVGYENPTSFYRAFRSWEGTSPAEWRAANQRETRPL